MTTSIPDLLGSQGYKLVEDSWKEHGRRTYIHDDDATRQYFKNLAKILQSAGWKIDSSKLRSLQHPVTGEIIEVEPGGSETSGHFLHHMSSAVMTSSADSNH